MISSTRAALAAVAVGLLIAGCSEPKHQHGVADAAAKSAQPAPAEPVPAQPIAPPAQDAGPVAFQGEGEPVPCTGVVKEHDDNYFFCNHDYVPEGSPSYMGSYHYVAIELQTPAQHKGRLVEIVFTTERADAERAFNSPAFGAGATCAFELPKEFLAGSYALLENHNVPRFRMIVGKDGKPVEEPAR